MYSAPLYYECNVRLANKCTHEFHFNSEKEGFSQSNFGIDLRFQNFKEIGQKKCDFKNGEKKINFCHL